MDVKNTRLRFIAAKTAGEISLAVSSLPFKVEIKGNPVFDGKRWILWFVIPDNVQEFRNIEFT